MPFANFLSKFLHKKTRLKVPIVTILNIMTLSDAYSHDYYFPKRCLTISYIRTPAATEALSESISPCIGIAV